MGIRIESSSHTGHSRAASYWKDQIDRHDSKFKTKRDVLEYRGVASLLISSGLAPNGARMICLGTRNNHERDSFSEMLPGVGVYSLDISPTSLADHIMDFTRLPSDWDASWDIVYSNSLDHSYDSTETFERWIRIAKVGGAIALGVSYDPSTSASDICSFTRDGVAEYIESRDDLELLGTTSYEYETWVVRRLR